MNSGRPSFYRLLHRGRYHPAKATALGATEEGRLERERFAASAISFCLKHDEQFREHFWKSICRSEGSPERTPVLKPEDVWLEPPLWADLCLQYEDEDRRQTWVVIEIKTGASLKAKQNPLEKAFYARGGYGALFLKQKMPTDARRRYVVLGAQKKLGIRDGTDPQAIEIQERGWDELLAELPKTPLVSDLVDSLGKLHIDAFMMEEARQIKITDGLTNVGKAGEVLEAVCGWLEVTAITHKQYEAYSGGDEDVLGVYLKPTAKKASGLYSGLYEKICALAPAKSHVVWFGYITDGRNPIRKSVFFYCKNAATQERLTDKLAEVFSQPVPDSEDVFSVTVESPPEKASGNDLEWFVSVLKQAAKTGKRSR